MVRVSRFLLSFKYLFFYCWWFINWGFYRNILIIHFLQLINVKLYIMFTSMSILYIHALKYVFIMLLLPGFSRNMLIIHINNEQSCIIHVTCQGLFHEYCFLVLSILSSPAVLVDFFSPISRLRNLNFIMTGMRNKIHQNITWQYYWKEPEIMHPAKVNETAMKALFKPLLIQTLILVLTITDYDNTILIV